MTELSVSEYAKLKGISTTAVYKKIKSGQLRKSGKNVIIDGEDETEIQPSLKPSLKPAGESFKPFQPDFTAEITRLTAEKEALQKENADLHERLSGTEREIQELREELKEAYSQITDFAKSAQSITAMLLNRPQLDDAEHSASKSWFKRLFRK